VAGAQNRASLRPKSFDGFEETWSAIYGGNGGLAEAPPAAKVRGDVENGVFSSSCFTSPQLSQTGHAGRGLCSTLLSSSS